MLVVNFGIHLLAMLAVFSLATGLARVRTPELTPRAYWIGALVAVLWGLSPFLATTHLMIIQRMSSLAGLFVFAGLAAFVWAHLLDSCRVWRWVLLISGLGAATALAAYAKENGALLPLFALVILWLWIPRERRLRGVIERGLIIALAVIPSLLLLAYLAQRLPGVIEHGYGARRYFTPGERLMTQPTILLDYLCNLFLPRAPAVSPFMDQIPAAQGWLNPPLTLIAAVFWPTLLAVAVLLRRQAPYLLLGLMFFLVGHILESSFIGLELYFAHRNYIPAFGVYFALVFAVTAVPRHFMRLAVVGLIAYTLLFATVLFSVTSAWNHKHVNAEIWLNENPHSLRGAQFLSTQYIRQDDFFAARRVLDQATVYHPQHPLLQIQRTGNCIGQEDEFPQLLEEVTQILRTTPIYQPQAAQELSNFAQKRPEHICPQRDHAALGVMAQALLDNPLYVRAAAPRSLLYATLAFAYAEMDDIASALDYFERAFRTEPNLELAFYAVSLMANSGQYPRAYAFLQEVRDSAPDNYLRRIAWLQRLDDFRAIIEQSERIDSETHD
jgi:tetratricopeptide (TPR) repeat protein